MNRRRGFTLLELLIVIGVIVLLVSILLPVLNSAREQAKAANCQNHLRVLWTGFMGFAADHDNRMPGCASDAPPGTTDPSHYDWLEGQYSTSGGNNGVMMAPQSGTIFKYVGHSYDVYRCPSLDLADAGTAGGAGGGSNGRFDYTAFEFFSGTRVDRLPLQAKLTHPDGTITMLPCPTMTEESGLSVNGGDKDPNHSNTDQMGHQHWGGCYYAATDGSVQYFIEPSDCYASLYTALTIRQKWSVICISTAPKWGWWEQQ